MTPGLSDRFHAHEVTDEVAIRMKEVRVNAGNLARFIDVTVPDSREKSLALTNLEQVVFWANAGLARDEPPF